MVRIKFHTVDIVAAARSEGYTSILTWLDEKNIQLRNGWLIFESEEDAVAFRLTYK